ncbi:MAG: c-type cytochrome [Steroidobacteraceae bacterium]
MTRVRWGTLSAILACGALAGTAFAQSATPKGNPAQGKVISYTCLGCHGIDSYRNAYPNYEVPRLWGQSPTYIVDALKEYRDGQRKHPTMHDQASTLTPQMMADVAAYFGSVPLKQGATPVSARKPPAAATVCVACHGVNGIGVVPMYPDLAGQHADYLVQALKEYKDGQRKNPVMAAMAVTVKATDMWTIADYFASLKPRLKTLPRPWSILTVKR